MSGRGVQFAIDQCQLEDRPIHRALEVDPAILNRISLLPEADQHLLTLAISGRHTFREIGALVGSNPGSVCRRVLMLSRRLSNPLVIALLERPIGLSEKFVQVGLARFLFSRGVRPTAREMSLSEGEVRGILHYLATWMGMAGDGRKVAAAKGKKVVA
jgi:hypothetical protein